MKNYKFSLESVLKVRKNEEKNVLEDFVLAQNKLIREESLRHIINEELNLCLENGTCAINIQSLMMKTHYKEDLSSKLRIQDMLIEEKKIELEQVRKRLVIAQKDKKMMEKLKEKDLDDYKTEISKENQKEIDEFAVLRYKTI